MNHKFRTGQNVRLLGGAPYRQAADGLYEVVRQLPYAEGDFQYRIKSGREQYERVVKESEIETVRG
ncbi:hypothetical protein [Rhodoplanes roseus]|uniref:Uncharacterized protein n=1 Tax=Rhodoplanes roseus TaxID=29409 RepID=A0A327L6Z7_9BRAD|nr:hypothetical protein [Rhodoplanes roseus]RAI45282.1 hypothetical protein CH341_04605 [Rhodoplanes roseus]